MKVVDNRGTFVDAIRHKLEEELKDIHGKAVLERFLSKVGWNAKKHIALKNIVAGTSSWDPFSLPMLSDAQLRIGEATIRALCDRGFLIPRNEAKYSLGHPIMLSLFLLERTQTDDNYLESATKMLKGFAMDEAKEVGKTTAMPWISNRIKQFFGA